MVVAGLGGEAAQRPLIAGPVLCRQHVADGAAQGLVPVHAGDVHVGGEILEGIPEPEGPQQPQAVVGAVKVRPGIFVGEIHPAVLLGGIGVGPVPRVGVGQVFQPGAQLLAQKIPVGDPAHIVLGARGTGQHLQFRPGRLGGGLLKGEPVQPVLQNGVDRRLAFRLHHQGQYPEKFRVPVDLPRNDRGVAVFHIPPHLGQLVQGVFLEVGGVIQHKAGPVFKFPVQVPGQHPGVGVASLHRQHPDADSQQHSAQNQPEILADGLFHGRSLLGRAWYTPERLFRLSFSGILPQFQCILFSGHRQWAVCITVWKASYAGCRPL